MHCLPLGLLGELCINDTDCAGGLGCDTYTGTCENVCNGETCTLGQTCCGDPYTLSSVCCGGLNEACDQQLPACVSCAEYDEPCNSDTDCCDNLRDGNAVCGKVATDSQIPLDHIGLLEISGACCVPEGGSCVFGPCCVDMFCNTAEVCELFK